MISDASNKDETFEHQLDRIKQTTRIITKIIKEGHQVVITHGNGPQVGSLLLQQNASIDGSIKLPLYVLGALTQGLIGVMLQHSLLNEFQNHKIENNVIIIPTSVLVDKRDQGFQNPTKPIGPFYSPDEYFLLATTNGEVYRELNKGYRRVVASPAPKEILEGNIIKCLIDQNHVVIAVGGGGSPTIRQDKTLQLVDAVIDKDLASSVLAKEIGADMLLILTNVDGVYQNFGSKDQKLVSNLTVSEATKLLDNGNLGSGSMKPKVYACVNFLETGHSAVITSPNLALEAIHGNAGTTIKN